MLQKHLDGLERSSAVSAPAAAESTVPFLFSSSLLSSRDRAAERFDGQSRLQQAEGDGGR